MGFARGWKRFRFRQRDSVILKKHHIAACVVANSGYKLDVGQTILRSYLIPKKNDVKRMTLKE
jgi:hypothetical protein